jgi:membrane-bound metal-dependent hydrolase YbcI (DUF457 family)
VFVGHALLAFALVAGFLIRTGASRERALALGAVAGAFAAVPDVDIAYALVGVAGADGGSPLALAAAFWSTGNLVHRAVTHSLVVAPVAAVAVAALATGVRGRRVGLVAGIGILVALTVVAGVASGPLGAAVMALFGLALATVAVLGVRRAHIAPRTAFATALVGLVSHPFGDLFTGQPPELLYPLDATLLVGRVTLHADPTLHLLGAFGVELATVWLAFAVVGRSADRRILPDLGPRAGLGAGYAALLPVLPAPTLDLSYPFVFTILAVGALGVIPRVERGIGTVSALRRRSGRLRPPRRNDGLAGLRGRTPPTTGTVGTGLAAVTVAWVAYASAYAAFG